MNARVKAKAGFTLIETLVVLAITSLLAGLLFTIGVKGGQTVLRLGSRALETADSQLARDSYRTVVESLVVPALVTRVQAEGGVDMEADDQSLRGEADQISGQWLAARTTACGAAGDAGRMTLALAVSAGHTVLSCQLEDADPVTLVDLGPGEVHFQYSEDGTNWSDSWTVEPGLPVENSLTPAAELRRVYVRLASPDGQSDLVALATSGRSIAQGGGGGGG